MIQHWVSDADALQFDYSVRFSGFAKRWGRYIVNGNAGRRFTFEHGTLLSRQQYLVDVQDWEFCDARLEERVQMNAKDIAAWTDAIGK